MACSLSIRTRADQIRTACLLECTAPKPGNVTPEFRFRDVSYADFCRSADVSAPLLARSAEMGVGTAILKSVMATRDAVGTNTNLGMLLLLAPLAAIPAEQNCAAGIEPVLQSIDLDQTCEIYEAIRLARPGGLGTADEQDVVQAPTISILQAMALAPHDRIAWQYTHAFEDVLGFGREVFLRAIQTEESWSQAIVRLHLELIARQSDSLILRKCGVETARAAQQRAWKILQDWCPGHPPESRISELDEWLRADGHRRNPGTTADLIAAILFALIRDRVWSPPREIA